MTALLPLTLAHLAANGSGNAVLTELVGTWRAYVPRDVVDIAKKMGLSAPQAQFVFSNDNSFRYQSSAAGNERSTSGTFQISDHFVNFSAVDSAFPSGLSAELKEDHSLSFEGLNYLKQANISMEGKWKLAGDGSTSIAFTKDGHFSFKGSAATSKGNYKVDGNQVILIWTEIDGESVDEGSVHKALCVSDDGALKIDSYRYVKQ